MSFLVHNGSFKDATPEPCGSLIFWNRALLLGVGFRGEGPGTQVYRVFA